MATRTTLETRAQDFKTVFLGSEEGQRVLAHIYKMCSMNKQIHDPASPHNTSFNAGSHRVGQGIQNILAHDENAIMQIIKLGGDSVQPTMAESYDPFNTTQ